MTEPTEPAAYRLEWRAGEYCYYTTDMYAAERDSYISSARVHELHTTPQPGCSDDIDVYYGEYFVQPKYAHTARDTAMTALYLGHCINEPVR